MTRAQIIITIIAVIICGAMLLDPPFEDGAIWTEGPTYAPFWRAPAAANEGERMVINWTVIYGQWALVMLPALALVLSIGRPWRLTRSQLAFVWICIAAGMMRILYPPEFGGGPFFSAGTGYLFHHQTECSINTRELSLQLVFIGIAGLLAVMGVGFIDKRVQRLRKRVGMAI